MLPRRVRGLRRIEWSRHSPWAASARCWRITRTFPERFWADWQYPDSGFLVLACFLVGVLLHAIGWASFSQLTARHPGVGLRWGFVAAGAVSDGVLKRYWAAIRSAIRPLTFRRRANAGLGRRSHLSGRDPQFDCRVVFSAWCWAQSRLSIVRAYVANAGQNEPDRLCLSDADLYDGVLWLRAWAPRFLGTGAHSDACLLSLSTQANYFCVTGGMRDFGAAQRSGCGAA